MRNKTDKFLLILIALALLILPLHFVPAATYGASVSFEISVSHHAGMDSCDHAGGSQDTKGCNDHASSEVPGENCCGDNCAGAQLLLTEGFNFHFIPATGFELAWSRQLPDPIASAEYRPPILIS